MSSGNRVLLLGNLNAKNPHWDYNCTKPNISGRILNNWSTRMITSFTIRYPYNGTTPSKLDIVKNLPNIQNIRTIKTLTSDHDSGYLELKTNHIIVISSNKYLDYKNTTWRLNRQTLDNNICINNNITNSSISEIKIKNLTNTWTIT